MVYAKEGLTPTAPAVTVCSIGLENVIVIGDLSMAIPFDLFEGSVDLTIGGAGSIVNFHSYSSL